MHHIQIERTHGRAVENRGHATYHYEFDAGLHQRTQDRRKPMVRHSIRGSKGHRSDDLPGLGAARSASRAASSGAALVEGEFTETVPSPATFRAAASPQPLPLAVSRAGLRASATNRPSSLAPRH